MSSFARDFLRDRVEEPARPRGFLALFGKHPGWDDHVEDLPLSTASLVVAKQILYVQGIGGQVSSGAWAKLGEGEGLPAFDHVILWRRGPQFIAGRLWASTDGKRRALFPMVALVHCVGVPLGSSLGSILSWLETVESACKGTRSAERVRSLFEQCQADLQGWIESASHEPVDQPELAEWGIAPEALAPAIYEIQSRGRDYTPPRYKERAQLKSLHCRVPATGRDRAHDLHLWVRLLSRALHEDVPQLLAAPRDRPWLDVVLGEPTTADFFPLRASTIQLPVIEGEADGGESPRADADAFVRACLDPAAEVSPEPAAPPARGWFSRLLSGRQDGS